MLMMKKIFCGTFYFVDESDFIHCHFAVGTEPPKPSMCNARPSNVLMHPTSNKWLLYGHTYFSSYTFVVCPCHSFRLPDSQCTVTVYSDVSSLDLPFTLLSLFLRRLLSITTKASRWSPDIVAGGCTM